MSKTAATIVLMLGGLILVTGCKNNKKDSDSMAMGPTPSASVAEINAAKLSQAVVPQPVQNAFNKDHPQAAIDNISMQSTSAGMAFYKITYISNGQPGLASYYASGAKAP